MRFKLLALLSLMAIIQTAAADVVLGVNVVVGENVVYDGMDTGSPEIYLDLPVDLKEFSYHNTQGFTADVNSTWAINNATLYVWNSSSEVYQNYLNTTAGNGSKYLGSHTFTIDSYIWGVYACDTPEACGDGPCTQCRWSENRTFEVVDYIPTATLDYPTDLQTLNNENVTALCTTVNGSEGIENVTLYVYNSTALYTTILNDTTGDGQNSFRVLNLPNDVYNYTCLPYDIDNQGTAPANLTFTIDMLIPTDETVLGACASDQGYYMNYAATVLDDYILLNFTDSSFDDWINDNDLSNVWIQGTDYYKFSDRQLVVNATIDKSFIVWFGGIGTSVSHTTRTPTIGEHAYLTTSNFTRNNPAYMVNILEEATGDAWNYSAAVNHVLDVYCDNYAPDRYDLKNNIGRNTFLVTTKEQALFHGIVDNVFHRKYEAYQDLENISLYFLYNDSYVHTMDYSLEDYTGTFGSSYFIIYRKINNSLQKIWQKTWYNLQIEDVSIENGSYIEYIVYTPTDTRVIGWMQVLNNTDKIISIREHNWDTITDYDSDLSVGFTSSYAASSIGIQWNTSASGLSSIDFEIYQQNESNQYNSIYSTSLNDPTATGSLNYVVPDQNQTYYVTAQVISPTYGTRNLRKLVSPNLNEAQRGPYYGTLNLPATILGIESDKVYTGVSMFLITATAMMFSAVHVHTGALVLLGMIGLTTHLGWFREMTWGVFLFLFAVAILEKFAAGRRKT